jgi:hypothetical protein
LELKVKEGPFIAVAYDIDGPTSSPVTAIGTAERNKFFSPKAARASSPVPCRNLYLDLIDELHLTPLVTTLPQRKTRPSTKPTAAMLNRV